MSSFGGYAIEGRSAGERGRDGARQATRELQAVSLKIVRTVRLMNGRNRQRFAEDRQLLGSWLSASTVLGTPSRPVPEPEGGPPGGEARPAA